ncbi:Vi polysaccharide biosynthesis protein VipA/TviB [Prochlorococcus marinus str. MU1404]|uniref:nucleotide sugar dehydrogenase n=1 Tax=Prochlorococcus marinus TaxID=1219 RepID=UPI001ADC7AFB|nr:nucleotide sugar dehydrogenase [Prochlorococcus marinus]MBO8230561.1 nucleotide sugar dehydrogenase [Prochlorococcus marinus XMU1404]MBW3073607.1 Vi polysaccharide biosynthesis protein VipA/TviB [Prochlorococcus marinus str. MU1404]MCR8545106.1 nucleotide sugar dehydrogenase [Prochlorococcus marinus CUG1432]
MVSNKELIIDIYPDLNKCVVAIIGLGYVGLPLLVALAQNKDNEIEFRNIHRKIIGFDINEERLEELKKGIDRTNEITKNELKNSNIFKLTNKIEDITQADIFIITVPTPIDENKKPDLKALKSASMTVAKALKLRAQKQDIKTTKKIPIVIYESTVYPGTTEEICIPIIEKHSGLIYDDLQNKEKTFSCGYSPERINPGDKEHKLEDIIKVTSGSNKIVSIWIDKFYGSVIKAGTFMAANIKTAEAAKVIENTQRDLNIALINELAIIFKMIGIDTLEVLEAASTKWNFLPFKPGLVGGHCIGVDPYYLTYKAESLGYLPEVVLAGRKINDGMSKWIAEQIILEMSKKNISISSSKVLILGFSFKENCPDIRNTKVFDLINFLKVYNLDFEVVDPWVNKKEAEKVCGISIQNKFHKNKKYDVVISCVAHQQFLDISLNEWRNLIKDNGILFDLKGFIPRKLNPIRI